MTDIKRLIFNTCWDKIGTIPVSRLSTVIEWAEKADASFSEAAYAGRQKPKITDGILHRRKDTDDEGSWRFTAIVKADSVADEEAAMELVCSTLGFDMYRYDRGPGQLFAHAPLCYRRGSRFKVTWSGGRDI